ncbi:MAG: hypothetical protein KDA87_17925 [Planctomycetales bacterium]|nr:hypothetical protein [Planctomycetales bacterium]
MKKTRLAVFASHYIGEATLNSCRDFRDLLKVQYVVTDDPAKKYTNAKNRIWNCGYDEELRSLVMRQCSKFGIPVIEGRIKSQATIDVLNSFQSDGILVSCFGQKLPHWLLEKVDYAAFNIHPVIAGESLARTRGPRPLLLAAESHATRIQLVIHRMTTEFDNGEIVARSVSVELPKQTRLWQNTPQKYRREILAYWQLLSTITAEMLQKELPSLFGSAVNTPV